MKLSPRQDRICERCDYWEPNARAQNREGVCYAASKVYGITTFNYMGCKSFTPAGIAAVKEGKDDGK